MNAAEIADLVQSLAWSVLGFLLGYAVGKTTRDVHIVNVRDDSPPQKIPPSLRKFDAVIGTAVLLMAVLSVIMSSITLARLGDKIDCQARYNERVSEALTARTRAAADDRKAMLNLVTSAARADTREESVAALNRYLEAAADADAARARNPFPEPPSESCR